jgi:hypothetical protein
MSTTPPGNWPTSFDYAEAIQAPSVFFTDADLKAAQVETDAHRYPVPRSGRFAIVFKARAGRDDLAIRCFTENVPTVEERYERFSAHLRSKGQRPPEYFVDFTYRAQGVMVEGVRYPLLRMKWSEGVILRQWVADNRAHRDRLLALASTWRDVMDDLYARGIAHGDLASDNCLVRSESDFTLIDYDGCFIAALAHASPNQTGQPDYQHPRRRKYYGSDMDAFPALVVYLSLLAVAADPTLWDSYNDQDSNLIFSAADYAKPGQTDIWPRLQDSPDRTVRTLAKVLERMCVMPVENLPALSQVLEDGLAWLDDTNSLAEAVVDDSAKPAEEVVDDPPDGLFWIDDPWAGLDDTWRFERPA